MLTKILIIIFFILFVVFGLIFTYALCVCASRGEDWLEDDSIEISSK